jgi:ribosome biogenesis protein Tsr3
MFRNVKFEYERSRLNLTEVDLEFYEKQIEMNRIEILKIVKIFDDKGGVLNRFQFKEAFENLNKKWLSEYSDCSAISDFLFRAFDKGIIFY